MTYHELATKLVALGCEELPRRTKGSHRKWVNRSTGKATVIPDWGRKDLKLGTIRAIARQLGLEGSLVERN